MYDVRFGDTGRREVKLQVAAMTMGYANIDYANSEL